MLRLIKRKQAEEGKRLVERAALLNMQSGIITEYDDKLTRQLIAGNGSRP